MAMISQDQDSHRGFFSENRDKMNPNRAFLQTINALSRMMEIRDIYTYGHQERVSRIARSIAQKLKIGADVIEGIRIAATIHDIGKIGIPLEILAKPAKLSEPEFAIVRTHSSLGSSILKDMEFPWPVADMVRQHHERLDGSGYPDGLKGDALLTGSQIIGVADTIEAIASHRPYRPALGLDFALTEIQRGAGRLFDPAIVDAATQVIENSEIDLSSGLLPEFALRKPVGWLS